MPTFIFLVAICLLVVASILLETDASPKKKKPKLEKGSSSSGKAQSTSAWRSVCAEQPIPKNSLGSFYYEVKISGNGNGIFIGFATNQMQSDNPAERFYAYSSNGNIWGHEVEGCTHTKDGRLIISKNPTFGVDDVIGCHVDLAAGQKKIIYTKNGLRLVTPDLRVDSAADLYPCVKWYYPGTKIEANLGPNFKFPPMAFRM